MMISSEKADAIVISKDPVRRKLALDEKILEQVVKFNYLVSQISSYRSLIEELKTNTMKSFRISGSLR